MLGSKTFRHIMYHARIGVLFSFGVQLVFYSIATIYSFSTAKIYTTLSNVSLIIAIISLFFITGELTYMFRSKYVNLKFMIAVDTDFSRIAAFKVRVVELIHGFHDVLFTLIAAALIALLPNRLDVLSRALYGLAVAYGLSVVAIFKANGSSAYKLNFFLKMAYSVSFVIFMVCLVELDSNNSLEATSIYGLTYFAYFLLLVLLILQLG